MRYLIFSDAHGHLAAVQELQEKTKNIKVDRVVFLGDSIGSGSNSNEVVEALIPWVDIWVQGNHESDCCLSIIQDSSKNFNGVNRWGRVKPYLSEISNNFIKSLWDRKFKEDSILFSHGDPRQSYFSYLYVDSLRNIGDTYSTVFDGFTKEDKDLYSSFNITYSQKSVWEWMVEEKVKICCVGHTHVPGVAIKEKSGALNCFKSDAKKVSFKNEDLVVLNPGSCASPREGSNSCFIILDTEENTIEFNELDYGYVKPSASYIHTPNTPSIWDKQDFTLPPLQGNEAGVRTRKIVDAVKENEEKKSVGGMNEGLWNTDLIVKYAKMFSR